MNSSLSRRKFIASTAASLLPSAVAAAQPKGMGLMAMLSGSQQSTKGQTVAKPGWRDAGVIDLTNSPYARLKTVPVRAVVIESGFWSQRRKTNISSSIPSMHDE